MAYLYCRDEPEIRAWVDASETEETAKAYLQEWVYDLPDHQAYLEKLGRERLDSLVEGREKRE
jgi:glutaconate CoA-transferase subunit A